MHRDFAQYFVDPVTKEPLHLTIVRERHGRVIEGAFDSSIARYPIVNGIPRFVDPQASAYASSFGYQWTRWPRLQFESENAGTVMEGYTRGMWEAITGRTSLPADQIVLDVGCGPGRFIDVARSKGARVIGVDYSGAVEPAARSFAHDPGVCICQGDALHLPIRSGSMDGVFTIGALHHTPDPACGVREAVAALAPDGWFAISVYTAGGFYDARMVQAWRRLFVRLWPYAGHMPPLIYAHVVVHAARVLRYLPPTGRLLHALCPSKHLPDVNWSVLDTFDGITPSHQSAHTCHEVFSWLKRAGLRDIEPTPWAPTSFRGCAPHTETSWTHPTTPATTHESPAPPRTVTAAATVTAMATGTATAAASAGHGASLSSPPIPTTRSWAAGEPSPSTSKPAIT
jgi:SAM-dependent methyltransferase